jgi:hypothetical protein
MGVTTETWMPPPGWRAEFEKQATREMMDRATRYARRRVKLIERFGRKVDPLYARELVQDAVGDTLDGTLTWDPARATLAAHVVATVHSRTRHEVVRAVRLPHRSLDDSGDDNSVDGRPLEVEASHALARELARPIDAAERHARRAVEALRRASADEPLIGAMLDAFADGQTERREVMAWTGMSATTYNNVRHRLMRLVAKLPAELREDAAELLA